MILFDLYMESLMPKCENHEVRRQRYVYTSYLEECIIFRTSHNPHIRAAGFLQQNDL